MLPLWSIIDSIRLFFQIFLFPKQWTSLINCMYFTISCKERTLHVRKRLSRDLPFKPKVKPNHHTHPELLCFLLRSQLVYLFIFLIKRNSLPQKYSEAANTTENESTIISVSFYICLKQTKTEPLAKSKNPNITDSSAGLHQAFQQPHRRGRWRERLAGCSEGSTQLGKREPPLLSHQGDLILNHGLNFDLGSKTKSKLKKQNTTTTMRCKQKCQVSPQFSRCEVLTRGFLPSVLQLQSPRPGGRHERPMLAALLPAAPVPVTMSIAAHVHIRDSALDSSGVKRCWLAWKLSIQLNLLVFACKRVSLFKIYS